MKITNKVLERLTKATPIELQAWMWGAGILGFGLGAFLTGYVRAYALWIIVLGVVIHGVAMYKIYSRK